MDTPRRLRRVALVLVACIAVGVQFVAVTRAGIPWGAMYTPNDRLTSNGMTGAVKHYRGIQGANRLLTDLAFARDHGVRLILTLGSVVPVTYLDEDSRFLTEVVHRELDPFFAASEDLRPFIEDGTIWGVRFLDEPHDPSGYPREFEVDPIELGEVFSLIRSWFGDVRIGSTAPPWYMAQVPNAGFAFGQVVSTNLPPGFPDPIDFHRQQSVLAHKHGLLYVASLNANTNPIDNLTFFITYRRMCEIETVDFATSWQWPQGHHPLPSFETRFGDPDPGVQAEISSIPAACVRDTGS